MFKLKPSALRLLFTSMLISDVSVVGGTSALFERKRSELSKSLLCGSGDLVGSSPNGHERDKLISRLSCLPAGAERCFFKPGLNFRVILFNKVRICLL